MSFDAFRENKILAKISEFTILLVDLLHSQGQEPGWCQSSCPVTVACKNPRPLVPSDQLLNLDPEGHRVLFPAVLVMDQRGMHSSVTY